MDTLPDKPAGSVIEESVDPAGVTLSWPTPLDGPDRYKIAAFLALWLCGWALGLVGAAGQLANGGAQPVGILWLAGWTIGGAFAIWTLCAVLRPARPESIRLEAELLRYDPGRGAYSPWQRVGWRGWGQPAAPKPTPAVEVARSDIGGFGLDRVGERQRLCLDRGADRLEIGAALREPEREWLLAVLRRWHSPHQPLQLDRGRRIAFRES